MKLARRCAGTQGSDWACDDFREISFGERLSSGPMSMACYGDPAWCPSRRERVVFEKPGKCMIRPQVSASTRVRRVSPIFLLIAQLQHGTSAA